MRKWTYLVAVLLMSGSAATFTSCIDNEEPAGITELRGAKAELLKAKAQVEVAEAAIKTAQAAYIDAQTAYQAEVAAQAKIRTEILAAQSAKDKAYWEQEAQKSAEEFKADLLAKQQATAEAQANYDKAILDIQVALVAYKENVYAAELQKVLTQNIYTVTYTDANNVTQTVTLCGLMGINSQIQLANSKLATLMREKATMEFTYDIKTKIAATEGQLAVEKGELEGYKKDLENLKVIAGTKLEDWDAKYQEFDKKDKDLNAQKTALNVAEAEALKPIAEREKANTTTSTATSELAFTIPVAIQNNFYAIDVQFRTQAVKDAKGKHSYPNGVKELLAMSSKATKLNNLMGILKTGNIATTLVLSDNQLAQANIVLGQYKDVNDNNKDFYTNTLLPTWVDALKAYKDLFNAGKYYSTMSDYDVIVAEYNKYAALPVGTAAEVTAKEAAQKVFAANLKSYLTKRTALDGFKIAKTADATKVIDPTDATDWAQWLAIGSITGQFGTGISNGVNPAMGGAYKAYVEAAVAIGYAHSVNPAKGRCVEYTYVEYLESITNIPNETYDNPTLWNAGKAKIAFESFEDYEMLNSAIANQADWNKLYTDLMTLREANDKALEDLRIATVKTTADRTAIETEYDAKEAAIDIEIAGIKDIMDAIAAAVQPGATSATYDAVLQSIKNQIAVLEGGSVTTGNEFNFVSNGSIIGQEVVVASYEKLLAALKDGSYKPAEDALLTAKKAEITAQQSLIDALNVVFKAVSAKKDQLMAALTK